MVLLRNPSKRRLQHPGIDHDVPGGAGARGDAHWSQRSLFPVGAPIRLPESLLQARALLDRSLRIGRALSERGSNSRMYPQSATSHAVRPDHLRRWPVLDQGGSSLSPVRPR